jgi:HEAT repeat protein
MSKFPIDWAALADQLGTITEVAPGTLQESGGTQVAYDALIAILGEETIASAVAHYLALEPGFAVAYSILKLLRPPLAMEMCVSIFRAADDQELAASAIELLRVVADRRVLDWLPEVFASPNPMVRMWAIGMLDQLYMRSEIESEEGGVFVVPMLQDPEEMVRLQAQQVIDMWERDAAIDRGEEVD